MEGTVLTAKGEPLAGAWLRLDPDNEDGTPDARFESSTYSDARGKYALIASRDGTYRIRAEKGGFRPTETGDVKLRSGFRQRVDLMLQQAAAEPSRQAIEFSDSSDFTIAGVTDWNNAGLHGSDANVRTSDALAKETAALMPSSSGGTSPESGIGNAHRLAADAKEKSGDPVGAVNEYAAAVKSDPSEENYFAWGAELLLHRAGLAAVEVFRKGSTAHPPSARMHAGLGAAYYADGQFPEASAEMCRAADLDPVAREPYLFLGRMEMAAAEPLPCSEERLARFAKEQPANASANFYYGLVLWKKARQTQDAAGFAAAEQKFKQALAIDPSFGEAYVQLGLLYDARGQHHAASGAFQKATQVSPQLSAAHYQLSLAYRRAGNLAGADQEMKTYETLRRSEDAQLEKERGEMRQFVTVLKDGKVR